MEKSNGLSSCFQARLPGTPISIVVERPAQKVLRLLFGPALQVLERWERDQDRDHGAPPGFTWVVATRADPAKIGQVDDDRLLSRARDDNDRLLKRIGILFTVWHPGRYVDVITRILADRRRSNDSPSICSRNTNSGWPLTT